VAGPPRASGAGDASVVGLLALDRGLDDPELLLELESPRESGPGPNAGGGAPSESGCYGLSIFLLFSILVTDIAFVL
jgi:hypothetical protein